MATHLSGSGSGPPPATAIWHEERLRYQVLRFIYDHVGRNCDTAVTGGRIGVSLALRSSDVDRIVAWLDEHGYVHQRGSSADIRLTRKAIEYRGESGSPARHPQLEGGPASAAPSLALLRPPR